MLNLLYIFFTVAVYFEKIVWGFIFYQFFFKKCVDFTKLKYCGLNTCNEKRILLGCLVSEHV